MAKEIKGPNDLKGLTVAILATEGVEQVELTEPRKALMDAGADVKIVSPEKQVQMWNHHDKGDVIACDVGLNDAEAEKFDALVLPGGVVNPDQLRMNPKAVEFVRSFAKTEKPIAAICHGPWMLVEADAVRGQRVTSWPSLKTDLRNAGADWVDETVVRDTNIVTSRKPDDLPAFNREMIDLFSQAFSGQKVSQRGQRTSTSERRELH